MAKHHGSSVAAGAGIIFAGTLVSRVLGFVRENLLTNTFDKPVVDAFRTAILVPDLLYYLLAGGALSAVFIPVFAGYLAQDKQQDANRVANSIANLMMIAVLTGMLVVFACAPILVRMVAPGYTVGSERYVLAVCLAREMSVMVIFTALSGLLTGMLQSLNSFLVPVIVWNTYSLSIIAGISLFSKLPVPPALAALLPGHPATLGIHGAALGVVLGAISLVVIQLPFLTRHGFHYARGIDLHHEGVRKVLHLFTPAMAGLALSQVNLLTVPQILGSLFPPGTVNDIVNATRLVLLPLGLFGTAISSAAFPRLTQQASRNEFTAYKRVVNQSVRAILLLVMPSAVVMLVLAEPVVALVYGGGELRITDIQATGFLLSLFAWGIIAVSLVQFISRAFYALHDTLTPVVIQAGMVVLNVGFALACIYWTPLSFGGVAIAFSLSMILTLLLMLVALRRRIGLIGGWRLFTSLWKTLLASVVMGAVMYLVGSLLAPTVVAGGHSALLLPAFPFHWPPPDLTHPIAGGAHAVTGGYWGLRWQVLLQLTVALATGIFTYGLTLRLLKAEELPAVICRFRKRPAEIG